MTTVSDRTIHSDISCRTPRCKTSFADGPPSSTLAEVTLLIFNFLYLLRKCLATMVKKILILARDTDGNPSDLPVVVAACDMSQIFEPALHINLVTSCPDDNHA
jgi:hypothetical protein